MTTIAQITDSHMDMPEIDERMEMGTSPSPHQDDQDLDLDLMQDPNVEHNVLDDADTMQADEDITYDDEYMFDDTAAEQVDIEDVPDLTMDTNEQQPDDVQDEEILYDEEEVEGDFTIVDDSLGNAGRVVQEIEGKKDHTIGTIEGFGASLEEVEYTDTDIQATNHTISDLHTTEGSFPPGNTTNAEIKAPTVSPDSLHNVNDTNDSLPTVLDHDEEIYKPEPNNKIETINIKASERTDGDANQAETDQNMQSDRHEDDHVQSHTEPGINAEETSSVLHPVVIDYLGQEMSLFPPMKQDSSTTFLVTDSSLAYHAISKLLATCRTVLDESLEHDDELVLDIPSLGLHICEDSRYASEITLAQVIDIYLLLSRNEGVDQIDALYCSLSSRVCLESQFTYLFNSARDGKTYSEIVAEHMDSPQPEAEEYDESLGNDQGETLKTITSSYRDDHSVESQTQTFDNNQELSLKNEQSLVHADQSTNNDEFDKENIEATEDIEDSGTKHYSEDSNAYTELNGVNDVVKETQPDVEEVPPISDIDTITPHHELSKVGAIGDESAEHQLGINRGEHDLSNHADPSTPSSHTVEADHSDQLNNKEDERDRSDESKSLNADNIAPENYLIDENDQYQEEIDFTNDENFPEQSDALQSAEVLEPSELVQEDEDLFAPNPSEPHQDELEPEKDDIGKDTDEQDESSVLNVDDAVDIQESDLIQEEQHDALPPTTPSKQLSGKRKVAEHEDDLDLFDFDTPEPKRRRPS